MKKFLVFMGFIFICMATFAHTINWYAGNQIISTTTCDSGDTIIPPTAPAKTGYHFARWKSNYTRLEYVYMKGESYLLTDLVPTYDCKIEMDFQTTVLLDTPVTYLGGTTGDTNGLRFAHITNKSFRFFAFDDSVDATATAQNNTRYKYVFNNNVITLTSNDTTVFTDTLTGTGTTNIPLALKGYNMNGTVGQNLEGIYLYSFKMWDNQGNLIANYLPCVKVQPLTVGFYDTVSGAFKTATAGTFIAGPEVGALQ